MRPAAELDREGPVVIDRSAHRASPDLVSVSLTIQRPRAVGYCAVGREKTCAYRAVHPNAIVDLGFDCGKIVGVQRPRVTEVEAQPVGCHERALLRDMHTQSAAERLMQ